MNQKLKPLRVIKKENGYRIRQYVKTVELVKMPKLSRKQKMKNLFCRFTNPLYHKLSTKEKQILHTIAPLWANILEYNLSGRMIVTDDLGNRYNLNAMSGQHCLVGEAYSFGFGYRKCSDCYNYNMGFASLNCSSFRNHGLLDGNLKGFLNHYYENHWGDNGNEK